MGVLDVLGFAQVGQGHEIARVVRYGRCVGDPHFDAVDFHARKHIGQLRHPVVVVVAEVVCQEEVAVLVIVGRRELEVVELHAAARIHALRRTLFLRHHGAEFQASELHVGANAEQTLSAADQTRIGGQRYVARLDQFHDFVLFSLVTQFELLRVEVKRGVGVVVEIHVHLVAHFSVEREVHFLVKIKAEDAAVAFGQRGVVGEAVGRPDFELGRSLCAHAHAARAEDFFCRSERKLHVAKVEFVFAAVLKLLVVAAAEIVAHRLFDAHAAHLVSRQIEGNVEPLSAQTRAIFIGTRLFVVEQSRLQVVGVFHVGRVQGQNATCAHRGLHHKGHHRLRARRASGQGGLVLRRGGRTSAVRRLCRARSGSGSGCGGRACGPVFAPDGTLGGDGRCRRGTLVSSLTQRKHTQCHRP